MRKKERNLQRGIHRSTSENMTSCIKCGTCCRKGGPALHREDKKILLAGHIGRENLITIRKGELAFFPLSERPEPVANELIKIAGKGRGWVCRFFDEKGASCTIYTHRPLECRLLKCWDTSGLLSVIGRDTLSRADILSEDEPIIKFIAAHEEECSVSMAEDLISEMLKKNNDTKTTAKLTALVHMDLSIRSRAVAALGLSVEAELFYFGRPLFKILNSRGLYLMKSTAD